jgi:hypothetical protein
VGMSGFLGGPRSLRTASPLWITPGAELAYRVDGDRDGDTDPYDPADAIASAAH